MGRAQPSFDKQYVRDWAAGAAGTRPPAPAIPEEVVEGTRGRYVEAYERITGEPFTAWLSAAARLREGSGTGPDPAEGGDPRPAGGGRRAGAAGARLRGVEHVRIGRLVELGCGCGQLEPMCEKLLANPLVEDYEVEILGAEPAGKRRGGASPSEESVRPRSGGMGRGSGLKFGVIRFPAPATRWTPWKRPVGLGTRSCSGTGA